ncbi:NUDIX hydrolase [Pedococcus sp. NPDC057267]|uniref:NUDIX hydrolase n=1 Tax=Pedococcus sp. NPDC057267 TaxID=3346077 RepID=UPI00363F81C5
MEPTAIPLHSVSVAGVILDADRSHVLLIKRRDNGRWEPPGGVLELEETIEDGLRREIREETGVEVDVQALTGVYKNLARGIVALVYRCQAITEPSAHTPEASAVAWHALDAVRSLMLPAYAARVNDALSETASPATRTHDGIDLLT